MASELLCSLSLAEASALIGAGEVSPVELTQAALARIERLEPALHAFVRVTPERALEDARRAQTGARPGPPHRIPDAVKDLNDPKGIGAEGGTRVLAGRIAQADAAAAARL